MKFHFFQNINSRFANARGPSLLEWAIFVSAELFVPLLWTRNMKTFLSFMIFFQQPKYPFFKTYNLKTPFFFFQFVYSRFANARSLSLLGWAIIVSAERFVPLRSAWNMKKKHFVYDFLSSQKLTFLTLRPWNSIFFQFVYSRIANARGPNLLEWAIIVSAELFVPLQWTWDMKIVFFMIF